MKKLILPILIISFITYGIYNFYKEDKINYVALGDSLAIGENPYKEIGYGYADNIKEYLQSRDKLKSYTKEYAKSGDKTEDLIEKIKNNKKVTINNEKIGIKRALREADLVTLSIGANDFMESLDIKSMTDLKNIDNSDMYKELEQCTQSVEKAIVEVKKYAKKNIILVGYYNPVNKELYNNTQIDSFISYCDTLFTEICAKQQITYIKIADLFQKHADYLPNPFNIHPNYKGYQAISTRIIEYLEKNNKKLALEQKS